MLLNRRFIRPRFLFVAFLTTVVVIYLCVYHQPAVGSSMNVAHPGKASTVPFSDSGFKFKIDSSGDFDDSVESKHKLIIANPDADASGSRLKMGQEFFSDYFTLLADTAPGCEALKTYKSEKRIYQPGYDGPDPEGEQLTEEFLGEFLQVDEQSVNAMKMAHRKVVASLPSRAPPGLYKGNGYVYVGGGKFNWLALLSIKSLRSAGAVLPVEVIIPTIEEYEVELCGQVLPAMNARCVLLPRALGSKISGDFEFKGYQYKSLALLVSSFENVLLLDADNIPLHNPDLYFTSKPFTNHGLVSWPDFWKRTTSPKFYEIAGVKVNTKKRVRNGFNVFGKYPERMEKIMKGEIDEPVPLHDFEGAIPNPSSESGQVMISKASHLKELFLALYYNLYGPSHYYPLFSQGVSGEGDKETFVAASVVLKNKYYQVNTFLRALGHFDSDHNYVGTGMGQYDLVEDYHMYNLRINNKLPEDKPIYSPVDGRLLTKPRLMFIHANFPKLEPWALLTEKKVIDAKGNRVRLYGDGIFGKDQAGRDVELAQYKSMWFLLCDIKVLLEIYKDISRSELCKEITTQINFYEANTFEAGK